jgi:dTDP-4-dehydrorhamnose reductase
MNSETEAYEKIILVTGAGGQLGMEIWKLSERYPYYKFLFTTKEQLPIDNFHLVKKYFEEQQIDYCINCAAYTAVDKAEVEKERAFIINADAAGNLASICKAHQTQLIHISTDYVFDGTASNPYKEEDRIAPVNTYGASKLKGEELVLNFNSSSIIIRTSWVYSMFGSNFVKTMLRLFKERQSVNVVSDQFGSPTYAANLAEVILSIIEKGNADGDKAGIYNYCNEGVITWFDFAAEIKKYLKSNCKINPIPTSQYPTPAKRPHYSVLQTSKIKSTFNIQIPNWKVSLHECLSNLT